MSRRKLSVVLVAFLLGILCMKYRIWQFGLIAGVCLVLELLWCMGYKRDLMLGILVFLAFGTGAFRYQEDSRFREEYEPQLEDNREVLIQGTIYKKEIKSNRNAAYLKNCILQIQNQNYLCNNCFIYLDSTQYQIGKTITVNAKLKTFSDPRNDGNFDEKTYYQSQKIDFKAEVKDVTGVYGKTDRLGELLYQEKEKLKKVYDALLSTEDAGVMETMVLGEKSALDAQVKEAYQKAGISHILAISGLHISLIGMTCFMFLRKGRISYWSAAITSSVILLLFGRMTGMGISTKRAVGMFVLLMIAYVSGRAYDSLSSLCLLALLLLYENPFLLDNSGFLFSFTAVFAAGVYQSNTKLTGWKNTLGMSLAIQLVTLPLMACSYYSVALYTILVNLFVLPFVGVLLGVGIAGGILGLLLGNAWIVKAVLYPCHLILWFYQKICSAQSLLPGGKQVLGSWAAARVVIYYSVLAVLAYVVIQNRDMSFGEEDKGDYKEKYKKECKDESTKSYREDCKGKYKKSCKEDCKDEYKKNIKEDCKKDYERNYKEGGIDEYRRRYKKSCKEEGLRSKDSKGVCEDTRDESRRCREIETVDGRRTGNVGTAGNVLRSIALPGMLFALLLGIVIYPGKSKFEIDILDVGQGDGIYIQNQDGMHLFIDGGSSDVNQVGKYRIQPFLEYHGVRQIDYWFITHLDDDHCSGLEELLEDGYPIANLVLASNIYQDDKFFSFRKMAKKYTNVVYMKKGDALQFSDLKLTCLFPDGGYDLADRNARSMVLYLQKESFSALFTGDIGQEQEERLLEQWKPKHITLYKAAHHGSKYSNGSAILENGSPEISVISCAYYNRYGHPGKEAVAHMKEAGSEIYYTMYSGQIGISLKNGETIVEKMLKE